MAIPLTLLVRNAQDFENIRTFGTHLDRHRISYTVPSNVPNSTHSASTSTMPTPSPSKPIPAYTSPNDYLMSIVVKAPIETLLFEQLDIAQQFYLFQQKAKRLALQAPLMIEERT
ncbi:hypothetical protein G6F46_007556 [Rhizopus delemar]|uniref:Uncharacterized protein n=2 Tax=Rhizopus TaxID=4842 RepID=A0A9P6Z0I4_9FUNG|nr:hypothetical protein G6F36_012978 [Rhizopus arrhizus]KAG1456696.1 hypothetical protein G6F55_006360 [Rhizopus delemar]KAG1495755.1 hypothetical protein G6F54_006957 [Rhizopus delemar]KAG1509660.1 hypothetical protein G6F53_007271 [Rhizopus delemar]KAG1526508.1 hypothetical protein G6F52_002363 [Rhizopus delemar]